MPPSIHIHTNLLLEIPISKHLPTHIKSPTSPSPSPSSHSPFPFPFPPPSPLLTTCTITSPPPSIHPPSPLPNALPPPIHPSLLSLSLSLSQVPNFNFAYLPSHPSIITTPHDHCRPLPPHHCRIPAPHPSIHPSTEVGNATRLTQTFSHPTPHPHSALPASQHASPGVSASYFSYLTYLATHEDCLDAYRCN